ncbi:MAG: glycosyltransferase family 4 protein [Deltaproteobacteria bacterium]|nr:glycosyltransferase family 4 protein [Deltaproteobacteria bacterium]
MKPKILQVVLDMQYVGEKIVATLARKLSDEFQVSFCCLDTVGLLGEDLRREGFEITALGRRPGLDLRISRMIAALASARKIDILQAHHYTPFFYAALSRYLHRRPRLVFTEHGRDFPDIVKKPRRIANLLLNLVTNKITSVCEHSKKALAEKDGFPSRKIHVIYNGIEPVTDQDLVPTASHQPILEWIGEGAKPLGFLARLDWIKNPELLLDAFTLATRHVPRARLIVMGRGDRIPEFQDRCRRSDIQDRVLFTGLVKKPLPIVAKLCALVVTSRSEAASLSILEAMMCGVPVIASDVGGNPELVRHGVTGLLAPSEDAQAFADHMVSLLENPAFARKLGASAREEAMKRFSVDTMVAEFRKLYLGLLES